MSHVVFGTEVVQVRHDIENGDEGVLNRDFRFGVP
jgi:hypothetical protein